MTYFDHDHRKSKNVRFLAISPPIQDLWCSPSRGVSTLKRDALDGVYVMSDCDEAKIRDACMAGVVQKDIYLARYQWGCEAGFEKTTHSLEVPMN